MSVNDRPRRQTKSKTREKTPIPTPLSVTVFGGSGFIGQHLVRSLQRYAARVAVAVRGPQRSMAADHKGKESVLEWVAADVTDFGSVARAVQGVDTVINLVGILYEKGSQSFENIHEHGARNVAKAAREAGAAHLIQMSALGASPDSPSLYARSKAAGENAARDEFPAATIIRPSIVFGPEDDFFNRFAGMARYSPALPLIGGGKTRFQPVFVEDVADAIMAIPLDSNRAGKTYELAGPTIYTFEELMELMLETMGIRRMLIPVPFPLAEAQGTLLQLLPTPPLTRDQVELLKTDNIASREEPGLSDLGIEPTALEAILPSYIT